MNETNGMMICASKGGCGKSLPIDQFRIIKTGPNAGYIRALCRSCISREDSEWRDRRQANTESAGKGECPVCRMIFPKAEFNNRWHYCRRCSRNRGYRTSKFRVIDQATGEARQFTVDDYDRTLQDQGNGCAVCGSDDYLAVDHSHTTGFVRGILCVGCNRSLGKVGDDLDGLMRFVRYLAPHEPDHPLTALLNRGTVEP